MKLLNTRFCPSLLLFFYLFFSEPALYAANAPTFIIAHTPTHQSFATKLQQDLAHALPSQVLQTQQIPLKQLSPDSVIITLGKTSFKEALQSPQHHLYPILATLISSRDYYLTLQQHYIGGTPSAREQPVSALFSDPSPLYQLQLSALLMKKPLVAVIYDEFDQRLVEPITQQAKILGLPDPLFIPFDKDDINQTLKNRLIVKADVLLATPNRKLYNSQNAKNIVFTLLARHQALIGYSTGWVKSGALATVYSSQREITSNLITIVQNIAKNHGSLPVATHPDQINVKLNANIAQMLGITTLGDAETTARLREGISPDAK